MADVIEIVQGTATTVEVAGPTGPQGPAGAAGATGAQGPQGPAGTGTGIETLTTKGDLLSRNDSTAIRVGIGTTGQILKVSAGGIPEWGAAPASGVTSVNGATGAVTVAAATHAASHASAGSDPVFNQNLNTSNEPSFAGLTINGTAVAGQTPDTVLRGGAWFGGSSGTDGVGIYKETSYGGNAVALSGVNQAVTQYNNIILAASSTPQLYVATNANVGIGSAAPAEKLDVGGNLVLRDGDNESQAEFDDTIAGTTGDTGIRALYYGTIGNSVVLNFDGVKTISDVIDEWNEDNADNTITLFDGSGAQVPSNGASVSLTGGVSRRATFSVSGLSAARSYTLPNASGTLALTSDISGGVSDGDKGDITVSASGATWTIDNNAVSNAKLAQVATSTLKGRATAATGNVEDLTASQARTILNVADGATANSSDATLLARANHTGTQAHTTVTGLGGAATLNVGTTAGTVAAGDDARLSDARTPTSHTHPASSISDSTTAGRALLTGADAAAQRTSLGLGTLATQSGTFSGTSSGTNTGDQTVGTTAGTVAAGDHTHTQLHDRSHAITSTGDHTASNWSVFYSNGSGQVTELGLGASGTILTSAGATSAPTFSAPAAGGSTNLWIPASAWIPRTTTGCGVDSTELSTNKVNTDQLLFDTATEEYAQAMVVMPSNYNNSTITARFYWTAASGSGGVAWGLRGRAYSDDDALDAAQGTGQVVTDTFIAANDMHVTAATSAITLAGTPAANRPVQYELYRVVSNGSDTLGVDARLLGVEIIFN